METSTGVGRVGTAFATAEVGSAETDAGDEPDWSEATASASGWSLMSTRFQAGVKRAMDVDTTLAILSQHRRGRFLGFRQAELLIVSNVRALRDRYLRSFADQSSGRGREQGLNRILC